MKNISVAVIGAGYWGPSLIRNFVSASHATVKYVCDLDQNALDRISSLYPTINCTTKINTVLQDSTVDLISIATPVKTHFPLAKMALLAKKHVLIEKPMTDSPDHAEELIQLAKRVKKKIFVGHTFVYSEPVKKLKELLQKNSLGEIYYYDSTRINLGLLQSDINVLWDLSPHDFSIINYLFPGKISWIQVIGSSFLRNQIEELVHVFMKMENGTSIHLQLSWLSPIKVRNITIAGSQKMVTYDDIEPTEKIRIYDKGVSLKKSTITPFSPAYRSGNIVIPRLKQKEALFSEIDHVLDCIRNNKKPLTGGTEGAAVVKLIELAEQSLRTGKKIVIHE